MKIETKKTADDSNTVVVRISGEATLVHAEQLREALLAALGEADVVTVDVSAVDEADLSLFQILCSCHRSGIASEKKIILAGMDAEAVIAGAGGAGFIRHTGCAADAGNTCLWSGGTN